eukprot:CAMPEP_0113520302 /NCGR_PEP_ID=MMETSP0014_2-20120614/43996_1 /TAXON_ID=2857 /ORGANISM="Nitzschia sp." /LENGTH=31 /DNA_ID=CAMNT_0000418109 /DNA_START=121 /DNA_END=213 /DNA_ORIENTATION=+ /assembly_acc=CAM_ASM_000159
MSSTNIRQHQYIDADPAFILETSSYADAASA